ncbi:MAG: Pyrroline-5-carboxylate reductase [Pseudomonadota bacterium]
MQALETLRVAFIGGGNMGRGMIGGLIGRGLPATHVTVADLNEAGLAALAQDFGVLTTTDNAGAIRDADVVVLAVKPQQMGPVVEALRPQLQATRPLLLSVAAGLRAADLSRWAGDGVPVVRAMPNRPALVGAGASGLYADQAVTRAQRELAAQVMAATGLAVWVDTEAQLDTVTALSGSGPAYFFRLAELMAEAAVAQGMAPQVARALAAQTLAGAGQLVAAEKDDDLARMRAEVTSKGGTTEAALGRFAELGLGDTVRSAMDAAATRSRELADLFGKD